ncbi:MAG TPA: hypothetical protein VFY29_17495 [Terriglobia bacterium]|nr:hypothetical protein [Terriglobia bacterium]
MKTTKTWILLLAMFGVSGVALAQNPDDYRGGWRTDGGEPHTYEFSIRGEQVRGIYCTRCSDATTLAFVDGKFGADGVTFVVTHVRLDGSTEYQDRANAKFDDGKLIVTGTSGAPGGGPFRRVLIKDPRGPDPLPVPVNKLPIGDGPVPPIGGGRGGGAAPAGGRGAVRTPGRFIPATLSLEPAQGPRGGGAGQAPRGGGGAGGIGGGRGYLQPGPWKQLKESDVIGVWLGFGVGVNKQYFIIRKVGDKLRGMVCGRCDNPYTMAALDDFVINGEIMTFNILHEDWGPGSLPSHNQATVRVAQNEMRLNTQMDNTPAPAQPPNPNGGTSLLGPISIETTRGNL